jgi:hypothetical protein
MVNMNIKSDDSSATVGPGDYNASPTIYLTDDQCEALGITTAPAPGTVYMLKVRAVATRVTAEAEEPDETEVEGNGPDISLTLQLTDMEIVTGGGKDAASMLYGD